MKSIVLSLSAAMLGMAPLVASAASQVVDGVKWKYTLESGTAVVTAVSTPQEQLTVPATLGQCPVVAIANQAFKGNETTVSITLPNGLKSIGESAFEECSALASITIPGSVTNIGKRAFKNCAALSSAVFAEGVQAIGQEMFADCIRLRALSFPKSLKSIGKGAFGNCRGLATVNLGSVETIGDSAFLGCSGLKTVTFPDGLLSIGASSFANCFELVSLSLPTGVRTIDTGAFSGCYLLEFALLPSSFKSDYERLGIPARCVVRFWDAPTVPTSYTVKFNANGGSGKMAAKKLAYGRSVKLPKNAFTRKDYFFVGWAASKTGAIAYPDQASVKNLVAIGGTTTLYAQWAKQSCKVKFYANGGTGKMAKQTLPYGVSTKLSPNKFEKPNYVFRGWSKTKDGNVAYKDGKAVKNLDREGRTVKLYAQWAKRTYKVVFYANDGSGRKTKQIHIYGQSATLRKNTFDNQGRTFVGWATTSTGSVAYADGQSVKNLRIDGKTVKLYAVWVGNAVADNDAVAFSLLEWKYGGFNGSNATIAKRPRISSLAVSNDGMAYTWKAGGCEDLGASSATDASCLACLFTLSNGKWVGGKFDWISTSRKTRDFKNIKGNYNGWPPDAVSKGKSFAFVIVSKNGRERTNVIRFDR